mmetsp:Transcript_65295/g.187877  ORF Transcript_65295/g.187877 Transcript_65295/m.187877 type:complete len:209 (+) Transcript_65295:954-1580(+)
MRSALISCSMNSAMQTADMRFFRWEKKITRNRTMPITFLLKSLMRLANAFFSNTSSNLVFFFGALPPADFFGPIPTAEGSLLCFINNSIRSSSFPSSRLGAKQWTCWAIPVAMSQPSKLRQVAKKKRRPEDRENDAAAEFCSLATKPSTRPRMCSEVVATWLTFEIMEVFQSDRSSSAAERAMLASAMRWAMASNLSNASWGVSLRMV